MSDYMFVKHPNYMGRQLSLHVGSGQRTIFDNDILEGPQWQKFEGEFLRRCTDKEVREIQKGRENEARAAAERRQAHEATQLQKAKEADEKAKNAAVKPQEPTAPVSRREALEAMDADALYVIAQDMDLNGRSKLKGDQEKLVEAILGAEEAEEKASAVEAEKAEKKAAADAEAETVNAPKEETKDTTVDAPKDTAVDAPKGEGGTTKSPASKVKAG